MKCQDVERYLQAYVDGEFSDSELTEIEQHFKFCPVCQKKVAYAAWFKNGLKNSLESSKAPKRLHQSVGMMISDERSAETPKWVRMTPVLATILVFFGVFMFPRIHVSSPIVEATVDRHLKDLPYDVQSDDTQTLGQYFHEKINTSIKVPYFKRSHLQLLGGRVSTIGNHTVAYMAFFGNGRRYSMIAQPITSEYHENAILDEGTPHIVDNRMFTTVKRDGYNVVVWSNGRIIYSFTSDENETDLVQLAASVEFDDM